MTDSKGKIQAFQLGVFAGDLLISKGVIQPDFQIDNIGIRNGVPVLVDYADIIKVDLPEELTKDIISTIKESIFSLVDNYEGSFENNSYVRAGFIARTGMLGHMVYESARDNGYSSFLYVEKDLKNKEHSLARITKWSDVKSVIGEWMEISLDLLGTDGMEKTTENEEGQELFHEINKYYLKNTAHILTLMDNSIMCKNNNVVGLYLDISLTALKYGMPYMAHGFAKKCKSMADEQQVTQICDMVLVQTEKFAEEYTQDVDKHIHREPIELMWILEDFDITVTR